ncbi:hypothetical protein [Bacillus horti]
MNVPVSGFEGKAAKSNLLDIKEIAPFMCHVLCYNEKNIALA